MKNLVNASLVGVVGLGLAFCAIAAPAYAGASSAQGHVDTRSVKVSYTDLDLSRQEGVDALYRRLKSAATKVCAPEPDMRYLEVRAAWEQCYDAALDQAVAMTGHVGVSQVHLERTGRRVTAERQVAGSE